MKKLIIYSFLLSLTACGGGKKAEDPIEIVSNDDKSPRLETEYKRIDFSKDPGFKKEYKNLEKLFQYIPYVAKTEIGNLYLYSDREYELPYQQSNGKKNPAKNLGMIDAQGKILLECKYSKIGNPGAIASYYVEVQQGDRYGLFNYQTKEFTQPQFDVIFPTGYVSYPAIGQKLNKYYKIYADGKVIEITNEKEFPSYHQLGDKRNFDVKDLRIALWKDAHDAYHKGKAEDYDYDYSSSLIFTPSYLAQLKVIPEFIDNIYDEESDFGSTSLKTKHLSTRDRNKNIQSFLEAFNEVGVDSRGWEIDRRQLVTVNKQNRVMDSKEIAQRDVSENPCSGTNIMSVKYLNDSLIEVSNSVGIDDFMNYFSGTNYRYFEISASGKITDLCAGSIFPMASVVKLNDTYLQGCFATFIETDESEEDVPNTITTSHLSLRDMEYMRNEIYARHGYIFTDPSWAAVFAATNWYKAKLKNVDSKLTPLEKTNLKFIKAWEVKLKENEEKYTQPKSTIYYMAG